MIIWKCLSILMMACLALAMAAKGNGVQIKVRPITREQYDSILKLNDGKPVIPEGRLINSAISGLTGLAAGFQLNRLLPNLFGNTQKVKDNVLGGYPLCTINTEDIAGRQLEDPSYVNVDELTNSLARPVNESHGTLMNCILVLDDGKPPATTEAPPTKTTTTPASTMTTITPKPETTKKPTHHPHPPHYPHYPHYPPYPHYPHYYLPYPIYPYYPHPPPHYHPTPEPETEEDVPVDLHSLIINKIEAITGVTTTTTTTTTKKPTHKTRRRPHNRHPPQAYPGFPPNYPEFNPMQTTPRRLPVEHDLDEYDDSVDYIEVSKKSKRHF